MRRQRANIRESRIRRRPRTVKGRFPASYPAVVHNSRGTAETCSRQTTFVEISRANLLTCFADSHNTPHPIPPKSMVTSRAAVATRIGLIEPEGRFSAP
jgi:hypothetical protein